MAPNPPVLSSAVIVPDADAILAQDRVPTKRRQSSVSTDDSKRPRLSAQQERPRRPSDARLESSAASKERAGQDSEERKRGKRLFGALLGTLNQSSSSTAQRRRGDIERKQQEKLALQAQEHDEQWKKDREALLSARRREQDVYVKQAATTRRENILACARFLQTAAEPKLYYKPWDLLPEQKAKIESQIGEAQVAADKQLNATAAVTDSAEDKDDMDIEQGHAPPESTDGAPLEASGNAVDQAGAIINRPAISDVERTSRDLQTAGESEIPRDGPEDGGDDFVKGDEDDVIY